MLKDFILFLVSVVAHLFGSHFFPIDMLSKP